MQPAPIPANETERVAALKRYDILDTPAEDEFDDFTWLASQICGVPIALISLIDTSRQWFKSRIGLDVSETPRDQAFCTHAIEKGAMLEVPNALEDPRFENNPLVTGHPDIRFYAGVPLTTSDGFSLGTLCVIDREERKLTDQQRESLARLGRQVVMQLELRLAKRQLQDRVKLQELAEARLNQFKTALEHHAVVAIANAEGIATYANDKICTLTGYSREELVGKDFSILCSTANDDSFVQTAQTVKKGDLWNGQVKCRAKDGSILWLNLTIVPFSDDSGKIVQYIAIGTDITNQLALTKEIEHANRELTDFAYVVSHDLKAPLRGIGTLASWLASDYADKLDETGREQLALMTGRVKRLNALIDGILTYSRAGRSREDTAVVDLDQLVHNVIDLLAPPPNIQVTMEGNFPTVTIEPTKAQQLFQNLISNAIKYMDKPVGLIKVRCELEQEEGFWHFSVTDNGPGIEAKYFERIFQLFQTLAPRDKVEGTGVGLALVKKIVELGGGKVWIESTYGEGCKFHFTLPAS